MRWNLRLAAANRDIWKASELQRQLAERGLVISAGKMSGLWSGSPASVKLEVHSRSANRNATLLGTLPAVRRTTSATLLDLKVVIGFLLAALP
jgi:hypothetical protein